LWLGVLSDERNGFSDINLAPTKTCAHSKPHTLEKAGATIAKHLNLSGKDFLNRIQITEVGLPHFGALNGNNR
jgi:hypothetical protein